MELILDASSLSTRAGLACGGVLRWSSPSLSPREHTSQLLPAIVAGLSETSATFRDLELIVVALGPGPFNGLRVAVSTAKGFAAGTGAAVTGISTLEAEAFRCTEEIGAVRPILAVGRSGFATALFMWQLSGWTQVEDTCLMAESTLEAAVDEGVALCGETDALGASLPVDSRKALHLATVRGTRLQALATLGWKRYQSHDVAAATSLQPLYVRPPHITIPRDRRP